MCTLSPLSPLSSLASSHLRPRHLQVVVKVKPRQWYHFLTTTCAIIGGVFTVAGIIDSLLYNTLKFTRKIDLGKQG
jgi:hypothetical protein